MQCLLSITYFFAVYRRVGKLIISQLLLFLLSQPLTLLNAQYCFCAKADIASIVSCLKRSREQRFFSGEELYDTNWAPGKICTAASDTKSSLFLKVPEACERSTCIDVLSVSASVWSCSASSRICLSACVFFSCSSIALNFVVPKIVSQDLISFLSLSILTRIWPWVASRTNTRWLTRCVEIKVAIGTSVNAKWIIEWAKDRIKNCCNATILRAYTTIDFALQSLSLLKTFRLCAWQLELGKHWEYRWWCLKQGSFRRQETDDKQLGQKAYMMRKLHFQLTFELI